MTVMITVEIEKIVKFFCLDAYVENNNIQHKIHNITVSMSPAGEYVSNIKIFHPLSVN